MDPERWQKIKGIFEAASALEGRKRQRFLDKACSDDYEMKEEVEKLLASFDSSNSFMEHPAVAEAASMFEEKKTLVSHQTTGDLNNGGFVAGTILASRYRILGLAGKGGMGEVYKADDIKLTQTVALKFLPDKLERDNAALERFHSEVRMARQVSHPNVCRVFDIGEADGRHFLSMEYVDGDDLSSLLKRIGRLPSDKAVEIARQLCVGLAAIHNVGILHRDFKPANVIIDGKGKARITDFGIAGMDAEVSKHESRVGTPAYMSPEQITGESVSVRSDIYALGLVLYEIFTGKPAFQADSITEIIQKHRTETPTNPSEHVRGIDPLVEKIIFQCLEKDPRERPPSALHVAMALPGGNPLQVALEAGQTPSPEMVAAAPKKGVLRPVPAIILLAGVVVVFVFIALTSNRVKTNEWVPLDRSPDVLADRSTQILTKFGYGENTVDTAYDFAFDGSYIYDYAQDGSVEPFDRIRTGQPLSFFFWHRTSPRYLEPIENGDVNRTDPPLDVSGMTSIFLDVRGRLVKFEAVPGQSHDPDHGTPTDWPGLFTEAGLDIAKFTETTSQWTPPVFADERKAWQGTHVDHPDVPVRIEAAGYNGKPVYFQIVAPWDRPLRETGFAWTSAQLAAGIILTALFFSALIAALFAAWRNLKIGRADTRGGLKLAVFTFLVIGLAQFISSDHVPTLSGELSIFLQIASLALFLSGLSWLFYVAVEPFVRKRWPELIISWSRLLAGDFRDPMVGRDVLVGGLLGLCHTASIYLMYLLPTALGFTVQPNGALDYETLGGPGGTIVHSLVNLASGIFYAVAFSFVLLLLLAVLRKKAFAAAAFWLINCLTLGLAFASGGPTIQWIAPVLIATVSLIAVARYGILATYTFFFYFGMTHDVALTADPSSWYFRNTIFSFVILTGLAVYAFKTSLAGRPIIRARSFATYD